MCGGVWEMCVCVCVGKDGRVTQVRIVLSQQG